MSRGQEQQVFNKVETLNAQQYQDAQNSYTQTQGNVTNFAEELSKFAADHPYHYPYAQIVRCAGTRKLQVHHKRRDGGTGIDNAEVLCEDCHQETSTYGTPGKSPEPFPQEVKEEALRRSGYKCECTDSRGCH